VEPGRLVGESKVNEGLTEESRPVQEAEGGNAKRVDGICWTVRAVSLSALSEARFGEVLRARAEADNEDRRK
jgi:hypothetical protein